MAKGVRGARMPKAKGHNIGAMGKHTAPKGSTAKRGASAVTGPQVAKAAHAKG